MHLLGGNLNLFKDNQMSELSVQKYLRSGRTLEDLYQELGIKARRHSQHPNLINFKYNQLESPSNHPVVVECRGLILDESRNWEIVAFPFTRFFNESEGHAAEIDWGSVSVQEKLDGSMCIMYHYQNKWHVATSGNPGAEGPLNEGLAEWREHGKLILPHPKCFADYFWQTGVKCFGPGWYQSANPEYCYMFELMGPLNRIVVFHEEAKLVLLGARHIPSRQEIFPAEAAKHFHNVPSVKEFNLSSVDEIVATLGDISSLSQEGYVVCDKDFNRIKIKSPAYVAIHHAKDGLTTKAFVEIARSGETSEVMAYFPEYQPLLDEAEQKLNALIQELEQEYHQIKDVESQKEFALRAVKTRCFGALFSLRSGKVNSISEFLSKMHIKRLMQLLGYKHED